MAMDNKPTLWKNLRAVVINYADLGFTAFGGPPVHFHILHDRFVDKLGWISEKNWQELFAVSQALPGPASTKMAYAIALNHLGFIPALLAFTLWSLPGALGMYGLGLGISRINERLPDAVYALITGLNCATVGLIALAGMQLSIRTITDRLSRALLIFSACAGLCYTALWWFPFLMGVCAAIAILWDFWLRKAIHRLSVASQRVLSKLRRGRSASAEPQPEGQDPASIEMRAADDQASVRSRSGSEESTPPAFKLDLTPGLTIIGVFFVAFATLMGLRAHFKNVVALKFFSNMVLAGTIIFGGGPVVIPLLREYVVQEGWVSPRDFLLGLAIIQAFPGPNFNFAVYLGALTASSGRVPSYVGAILGFIGIFLPGLMLTTGMASIWIRLRRRYSQLVSSFLRGINAGAIGLIWTAVYRLWEAGNLTQSTESARSLGADPWWLVITSLAFSANAWYKVPAPVCIVLGGALGLAWWGVR